MIEIYWDDLTAEKQKEIISTFGNNCNYDVIPIAIIETDLGEKTEHSEDDVINKIHDTNDNASVLTE